MDFQSGLTEKAKLERKGPAVLAAGVFDRIKVIASRNHQNHFLYILEFKIKLESSILHATQLTCNIC